MRSSLRWALRFAAGFTWRNNLYDVISAYKERQQAKREFEAWEQENLRL